MQDKPLKTLSYLTGEWQENETNVISEKPVSLSVNGDTWLAFMCTPSDLEALAIGFLFNEEIIQKMDDVASVRVCPEEDNIDVWLNQSIKKPERWTRTTGCSGGETSINQITTQRSPKKIDDGFVITAENVGSLIRQLGEAQVLYRTAGGVHTSALSDGERILISTEDIGRHNTLDKLAGYCLMKNIQCQNKIILTTGRVSSEMIQKADRIGAVIVITRTSPSSLSVEMAESAGITLIGYARHDRFTIYAHPERIIHDHIGELPKGKEA